MSIQPLPEFVFSSNKWVLYYVCTFNKRQRELEKQKENSTFCRLSRTFQSETHQLIGQAHINVLIVQAQPGPGSGCALLGHLFR